MADVRSRLATGNPIDVLAEVSALLSADDPRSKSPMERVSGEKRGVAIETLIEALESVDRLETTALLVAISQIGFDEKMRRRTAAAAARRWHPLPEWLERLGESVAYRAVEMVHILGDGDDLIIGIRLLSGHELSVLIYVDHNMGTIVKDAFIVPVPIDDLITLMSTHHHDAPSETEWRELTLADARGRADEALVQGTLVWPPLESETWPMCRPLVEWAVRLLPDGGSGYQKPEWSDVDRAELTEAFFASDFAESVHSDSYRDLFESLLWFGCDYGPGDPLRWSPVAVEIILADWLPRKVTAGVGFLSKAPALLRAFIRYAHDRRGIPPSLTAETLTAVDQWEPEYQRLVRAPRSESPYSLLAGMGALDPVYRGFADDYWDDPYPDWGEPVDANARMLDSLQRDVGGQAALETLDAAPLPDEEFAWEGVADDIRPEVDEILVWCDRYADERLDVEFRTACRRLLARSAVGDPQIFRRGARVGNAAAAACWIIGKANKLFAVDGGRILAKDQAAFFGLKQASYSQRAATLMRAAGLLSGYYYVASDFHLGTPGLLVAARRQKIIELRDQCSKTES